jgi:hypothetical protein
MATTVTETQYGFADQLAPYAEKTLGAAWGLADPNANPYLQYQGERYAQFSPLQQQSFTNIGAMQPAGQIEEASGLAELAAARGLNTQYGPSQYQASSVSGPNLQQYQMGPAQQIGTQSFTDQGRASQYMSPYMQNVVDINKREAQRQADIAGTQRGAKAAGAGAFGGARQAIENAEAQRNLSTQMGDIQNRGMQDAYGQGMSQFNAEQQARLGAQQANQQAGLTVGQQNLSAQLGTQQLGAQTGLQAQMANQQAAQQAAQLREQSSQYGAGLGMQGGQLALGAAGQLGTLGGQYAGQMMDINKLQNQYGGQQQAQVQNILGAQYQDFLNAQQRPYQQLGFMSDMIRGLPLTQQSQSMFTPPPSTTSQAIGLGTAALGLSRLAGGGRVGSGLADLAIANMA